MALYGGIADFINNIYENGFILLDIAPKHIISIIDLPFIHRDPFDRMLVAQAIAENISIMTTDTSIMKYNIKTIW